MNYPIARPALAYAAGRPALSSAHQGFAALIRRYPDLSGAEMAELHDHFSRLRALDIGLMLNDEELASRLEVYCSLHGRKYDVPLSGYVMVLALLAIVTAVTRWGAAS